MIQITPAIALDEAELEITFVRSPGAGGQNVNKVATAAQLRFNVVNSPSLPEGVRPRLLKLAGSRATNDGEIVITAHRFRTQEANRRDAVARLTELIRRAAVTPKRRIATRPTLGSQKRRVEAKKQRSDVKRGRGRPAVRDE